MLNHVNQMLCTEVLWQPLAHAGTTNHLYQGAYQGQEVVLRQNTDKVIMGVCREREKSVLNLIRTCCWAPTILHLKMPDASQPGWLLMRRYSELIVVDKAGFNAELLASIAEWQQIKAAPLFNYSALWDEYQHIIDVMTDARVLQVTLDSVRQTMQDLVQGMPQVQNCLVHHDLHPGNLLSSEGQVIVIDWEYAGHGTPWLDAAALITEFSLPLQDVAALPAFRDIDLTMFQAGLRKAQQINQQLNWLWYELIGNHRDN
ncbi:thiamine kinase [Neptunomonas antarctica]|uniref:Thiamine kinase n=2 Tax=Neptunomonas antarctica TaxID=619304 RepID=A0A1N7P504_9GAMM|nr:thiamine kinase [Neptunomonas antarctica]